MADTLSSDAAKRLVPTIMLGASTGIVLGSYATAALLPVFQGLATDHFPGNPDAAFFIMAQITVSEGWRNGGAQSCVPISVLVGD